MVSYLWWKSLDNSATDTKCDKSYPWTQTDRFFCDYFTFCYETGLDKTTMHTYSLDQCLGGKKKKKHKKKEKHIRDQHGRFALETGTWFAVASYILTNMTDMKNPWMDVGDSDNVYESLMPLWERTCFFCSRGMCVPCMGRKARGDNILSSTTSQQCDSWLKATQSTGTNQ